MKIFLLLLATLLPLWGHTQNSTSLETEFAAANKLYAQSKFTEAAAAYQQIITNGTASAALYFNLGNAHFKAGQLGHAIAAYRHAEEFAPRDPDIRANVQFARNRVTGPRVTMPVWRQKLGTFSATEWATLSTVTVWIVLGLLITRVIKPALRLPLRPWTIGAIVSAVLVIGCARLAISQSSSPQTAIVVVNDATIRNSPFDESPSAFTAHDGAELQVLDHKDDWLQVTDGGRNLGWIKRTAVEFSERS